MPEKSLEELLTFHDEEMQLLSSLEKWENPVKRDTVFFSSFLQREQIISLVDRDFALLIKLALVSPKIDELCKCFFLKSFWSKKIRECSANPAQDETEDKSRRNFEYQSQPTIHSFDLLKSFFLYSNYKKRALSHDPEDNKNAKEFLMLSAQLGCFLAMNQICIMSFNLIDSEGVVNLNMAKTAADLYLTPGYILLATSYFKNKMYFEALKCLILAEKLLPYSEVYVNNAYLGRKVEDIVAPVFGTIENGKRTLAALADISLADVALKLYPAMEIEMDKILLALTSIDAPGREFTVRRSLIF